LAVKRFTSLLFLLGFVESECVAIREPTANPLDAVDEGLRPGKNL